MSVNLSTANAGNPFLGLRDPLMHVVSYLETPEDLKSTALVCKDLHCIVYNSLKIRVKQCCEAINELVNFAELFDREINRITEGNESLLGETDTTRGGYHNFKFNAEKWRAISQEISNSAMKVDSCWSNISKNIPYSFIRVGKQFEDCRENIKECRLDLIEALAEYNSLSEQQSWGAPVSEVKDRPISKIDISNIEDSLSVVQLDRINAILDIAKITLKGDLKGDLALYYATTLPIEFTDGEFYDGIRFDYLTWQVKGIFFAVELINKESPNWFRCQYPRHIGGCDMSIDHLSGKLEGERIVIPRGAEKTEDRQVIVRCRQRQYHRSGMPFEQVLVHSFDGGRSGIEEQKNEHSEAEKKLEDAYGRYRLMSMRKSNYH